MSDKPVDLDRRRGMAAQHATELRRLTATLEARRETLRRKQDELESDFLANHAIDWRHAADKARYLLGLFADMAGAKDTRVQTLVAAVLADFDRLGTPQE